MPKLLASPAEDALDHLARRFAHWRQSRATPRERIPDSLWDQAVALTHLFPLSRIARRLGLCLTDLKKRGGGKSAAAGAAALAAPLPFVEVTPSAPWQPATAEIEIHRADGACMRLTYREAKPALAPLVQTFLESC